MGTCRGAFRREHAWIQAQPGLAEQWAPWLLSSPGGGAQYIRCEIRLPLPAPDVCAVADDHGGGPVARGVATPTPAAEHRLALSGAGLRSGVGLGGVVRGDGDGEYAEFGGLGEALVEFSLGGGDFARRSDCPRAEACILVHFRFLRRLSWAELPSRCCEAAGKFPGRGAGRSALTVLGLGQRSGCVVCCCEACRRGGAGACASDCLVGCRRSDGHGGWS